MIKTFVNNCENKRSFANFRGVRIFFFAPIILMVFEYITLPYLSMLKKERGLAFYFMAQN